MDAYTVVRNFERAMMKFTGAPCAISFESCSAALFLSCLYCRVKDIDEVIIPKLTYPSAPASVINAGGRVVFEEINWQDSGYYRLGNTPIVDAAKHLSKGMYIRGHFMCLSFHGKKILPIGRGRLEYVYDARTGSEGARTAPMASRQECRPPRCIPGFK